jgi:hypothetical protein
MLFLGIIINININKDGIGRRIAVVGGVGSRIVCWIAIDGNILNGWHGDGTILEL